jgi:hypothetical protein
VILEVGQYWLLSYLHDTMIAQTRTFLVVRTAYVGAGVQSIKIT